MSTLAKKWKCLSLGNVYRRYKYLIITYRAKLCQLTFHWNIHYPACCEWWGTWAWAVLSSSSMRRGMPALSVASPLSFDCPGPSRNGAGPGTAHRKSRHWSSLYRQKAFGRSCEISSSFDLRSECVRVISDLIEFRCSQNADVSVGPPAQAQLLAVSWNTERPSTGVRWTGIQYSYRTVKHTSTVMESVCVYPVWHKSGWGREHTWPWWVKPPPPSGPPRPVRSTAPWSPVTLLQHKLKQMHLEPCSLTGSLQNSHDRSHTLYDHVWFKVRRESPVEGIDLPRC